MNHGYSAEVEESTIRQFLEYDVEAVIVCHPLDVTNFAPLKRANIPIVQIERNRIENTHQIDIDLRPGFSECIEDLVAQGHKKIAFIGWRPLQDYRDPDVAVTELKRSKGFQTAISQHGLRLEDCPVLLGNFDIKKVLPR